MPIDLPANVPIDVVFARTAQAAREANLRDPTVVIIPDQNNWNDYGRRLYASVRIFVGGELSADEHIRFMFDGQDDTAIEINRLCGLHGDIVPIERSDRLVCSLLPTPLAYRSFVSRLGFDLAVSALRKMGDAVVVQLEGRDEQRLRLIDSEAFFVSMLRADDAHSALRRGGRFLRRHFPDDVEDAARSFLLVAQLPTADNRYDVTFNFEPDFLGRNRIAVLIGRNGVGKTQLLRHLVLRLAHGFEQPGLSGEVRLHPQPAVQRLLMFSSVTSDPYPPLIPAWFDVDYEYFSMTAAAQAGSDNLLQALVSCWRDGGEGLVINGERIRRLGLLERILHRIGLWRNLHLPLRPAREGDLLWRLTVDAHDGRYIRLGHNLSERLSLVAIREIDWSRGPAIFGDDGPRHLSSGETAMFRFAAQAVSAVEQGSLFLFDEPETHLHPNFVSDFMEILQDILQSTNSAAIIATHSAYVVREVPRERVNVLSSVGREVAVGSPRMQTFGASIDTISQFVFNDTSVSHRFQQVLSHWVAAYGRDLTIEQIIENHGAQLNPESLSYIAEVKRRIDDNDGL